jgi:hypothetical protein
VFGGLPEMSQTSGPSPGSRRHPEYGTSPCRGLLDDRVQGRSDTSRTETSINLADRPNMNDLRPEDTKEIGAALAETSHPISGFMRLIRRQDKMQHGR